MSRHSTRRGKIRGFTIVELMCAVVVMLGSILPAFAIGLTSLNVVKTSNDTLVAMTDLQAAMEKVMLVAHDYIPTSGYYPAGTPISTYTNAHLRNESIVPSYPGGITADPLTIRLTITWTDWRGVNRTAFLSSQKTK